MTWRNDLRVEEFGLDQNLEWRSASRCLCPVDDWFWKKKIPETQVPGILLIAGLHPVI
jgi:putative SOS response-associated peptidase YedK